MNWIYRTLLSSASIAITAYLLNGVEVDDVFVAIVVAVVMSLLNVMVKPLLIMFTIPVTIFTFGLFLFVINAMIVLLANKLVDGFTVHGFWWALIFSILLSIINGILSNLFTSKQAEN